MAPIAANLSRRSVLGGGALLLPQQAFAALAGLDVAGLETRLGTHIGLAALDTGSGASMLYRQNDRFLMCSTSKLLLAAAILSRIAAGQEDAARLIRYRKSDLMDYSPRTTRNAGHGMSVHDLCEAAVVYSDNTAATLLIRALGGPLSVTRFIRTLGDTMTRLDRFEPQLNIRDGDLDTTTPAAMAANLKTILLGEALPSAARKQIGDWMIASTTGLTRLRAGLPADWRVGDKSGSGQGDVMNDVGIAWPSPQRAPILICAYTVGGPQTVLAEIGKAVAAVLA